jgi:type VI secretion system protein ImpH
MAAESWRPAPSLEELLFDQAHRFEFFKAVRVLEQIRSEHVRVGRHESLPAKEVVRFRTRPTLEFPASEVHEVRTRNGASLQSDEPPEMYVSFMGLIGPVGVMPTLLTELVAERARYKDTALWEFLDLFNHRLVSLFYRAWERYRLTIGFERGGRDQFAEYLFSLIGLGTHGQREQLGFPPQGLFLYEGLLAQKPHSATAIESMLGDYFGVGSRLVPFTGQWLKLDDESICRLGRANSELGVGTIAGERIWDVQSKFRMRLGPMPLAKFEQFLPSGAYHSTLMELLKLIAGPELDLDVQLVLNRDDVPGTVLSSRKEGTGPLLGWTSFLKTRPFSHDDEQVVFAGAH